MRILLVEDDPILALSAAAILADAGHHIIGPAYEADDALRLTRGAAPDLALLDINLGGQDEGVALAAELYATRGVLTIFVSGQVNAARSHRGGALGLLRKPYHDVDLVRSVEIAAMLREGRSPDGPLPASFELLAPLTTRDGA